MARKFNQKEKEMLRASAFIGVLLGVWINVLLFIGPFADLTSDYNRYLVLAIKMSTIATQTLATFIVTLGFTWMFMLLKVRRWLSFFAGILGGIIAGSITFGLTMAVLLTTSITGDMVRLNGAEAFVNTLPWWRIFGYTFIHGLNFGSFFGAVIGALAGPVISFDLEYGAEIESGNEITTQL